MLDDGRYDVFVVDAVAAAGDADVVLLELAVLAGARKGEVVAVSAQGLGRDPIDLLGAPGTLTVTAGEPSVDLEG